MKFGHVEGSKEKSKKTWRTTIKNDEWADKVQTNVKCKHWYVHPLKSEQILHSKKGKKHISEKWATAFPG